MTWAWNPADKSANIALSGSDLVATSSAGGDNSVRGTVSATSGKYYWEYIVTTTNTGGNGFGVGVGNASMSLSGWPAAGIPSNGLAAFRTNTTWDINQASSTPATPGHAQGDRLGFALDATAKLFWMTKNGTTWYGSSSAGNPATGANGLDISVMAAGPYFPFVDLITSEVCTAVPDSASWGYTAPSGFGELGAAPAGDTLFAQSVM